MHYSINVNISLHFVKEVLLLIKNCIRVLRAEREWTQADLAEKLGVSRQAVISIEKYKYTPSLELAFKIAVAFHVSIHEVFEYTEGDDNE